MRALFFVFFAAAFAGAQQQGKIYGAWQNSDFGYEMTLMLNADGSGEFDGEVIKFSVHVDKLVIAVGTTSTNYDFLLKDNTLVLSGGDLDGQVTFTRLASEIQPATAAKKSTATFPSYSNTDRKLLGLWSGNGEMIEFRPDGNCVYLGNTFPYQISQGHIILSSGQGNVSFVYFIKGTQLTLTANGQQVVYNKVPGTERAPDAAIPQGQVSMELVGKWCYMNMTTNSQTSRCITLNADGTYTYSADNSRSVNTDAISGGAFSQGADRGTWYVQGDRIYYYSQTSGKGSYRLEKRNHPKNVGDPMIVLDGVFYVTATLRQPWR